MNKELEEIYEEYHSLSHAMQTGVAYQMDKTKGPTEPKHLRVGVNSALVSHSALVHILIDKGVFTELDYAKSLRNEMKKEVERYERLLKEEYNITISLH